MEAGGNHRGFERVRDVGLTGRTELVAVGCSREVVGVTQNGSVSLREIGQDPLHKCVDICHKCLVLVELPPRNTCGRCGEAAAKEASGVRLADRRGLLE